MEKEKSEEKDSELVLGIDDAGRGPLIGPMVLAGCLVTRKLEKEFKKLGVKDSKMLIPQRREFLAEEIRKKALAFHLTLTHPCEIDARTGAGLNLNKIEAIRAAEIINKLTENIHEQVRVIIDCPSTNRESWKNYVLKHINENKKGNLILACEHKADRDYAACSAASILAKSERERQVRELKKKIGKDFGSGYTSDPRTIEFLNKYGKEHKKDGIFRESWATFQNHKVKKEQKKLLDF